MRALERAPETKTPEVLAAELDQWAKVSGFLSLETTMRLARTTPDGSGYLDLLDWLGRARSSGVMIGQILPLWPILDLLRRNPERHGLHYWIRILLSGSEMVAPAVLADLRTGALDTLTNHPPDTPSLLADATLTRLWLGGVAEEEIEPLLETIGQQAKEEPFLWVDAADLTLRSALPSSLQEAVLVALLRRPDLPWQGAAVAQSALRAVLQSRRSGLADPTVWKRLGLPLPLPTSHLLAAQGFTLPDEPVGLSQIRITHVRGLADLRLDDLAPAPSADKGQWVVLLGPNGAGKTTLLRSLVLALRNLANPQIWPEGTFETPWRANKIPPTTKSTIQIDLLDGRKFSTTIEKNGSERLTRSPKDAATPFPVFAYGCRRGSAAGGATRPMKYGEDDGPEVATLFNEDARLIHAETWLKEWHGEALEKPEQSGPIYQAVLTALQDLLKVDKIVVRDRQVWVSGKTIGEDIPFAALSDGYLTTAGWFLDLIARWIELAYKHPKHHKLEGGKILQRMTGIVLLDEIDLHLHPTWQINVIPKVKELLPRMSFVVTTHNPLTLVGARPEEIWILGTEDGHVTAERGTEAPMLLTGGQIYSRYFGIKGVYPNDLGEALRRYGFLSGDPLRTDDEQREMEGLREKLRARGIEPGWEETPREAPSVPTAAAEIKKPVGTRKRSPARKRSAP
jgi:energy-coupling factor transporter ATP-binding protein EcfA2